METLDYNEVCRIVGHLYIDSQRQTVSLQKEIQSLKTTINDLQSKLENESSK